MPREASLTRSGWPAPALPVSPLQRTFFCTLCKRRSSRGHVTPCNPATARSHSQVRGGEEMTPWNSVTCARAPATFRLAPVCKPTPRARSFCGRHTRVNNDDDELVCSLLPDGRAAKAAQTAQTAAAADGGRGLRGQGRERHGNGAGPLGVVGRHPRARGALARSRQAAAQGGAPPQRALPAAPGAVTRGQGRGAGPPGPTDGRTPGRLADR